MTIKKVIFCLYQNGKNPNKTNLFDTVLNKNVILKEPIHIIEEFQHHSTRETLQEQNICQLLIN